MLQQRQHSKTRLRVAIFISHCGQAKDISPMQSSHTWAYWLRGTAIACQLNQELRDRMTLIHFPERGNVSPQTISVNLDQDKRVTE